MTETEGASNRRQDMTDELASLKLKDGSAVPERRLLALGVVLTVVGIAACVIALVLSQSTNNSLDQSTDLTVSILGMTVAVVGVAVWLRHSLTRYTRYFLARLIFEQRSQTDRIVEASTRGAFDELTLTPSQKPVRSRL